MRRRLLWVLLLTPLLAVGGTFVHGAWFASEEAPVVRTETAQRGDLILLAQSTGSIDADLRVDVKSRASGTVIELSVEAGDTVAVGDLLVRLDPTDEERRVSEAEAEAVSVRAALASARASRAAAEADAAEAQGRAARRRVAYEAGLVSGDEARASMTSAEVASMAVVERDQSVRSAQARVEQAELSIAEAQKRLSETIIRAPIAGTVLSVAVERGSIVSSGMTNVGGGTPVLTLADLSRLYVILKLDEAQIGDVRPDQRAQIRLDAHPERVFRGIVERIAPLGATEANVVTFDVKVRIVGEPGHLLRPGMSADVEITTNRHEGKILVPVAALRSEGRDRYVLLASGHRRPVKTGPTDGIRIAIEEGLAEGEAVIVAGAAGGDGGSGGGPTTAQRGMWMMRRGR